MKLLPQNVSWKEGLKKVFQLAAMIAIMWVIERAHGIAVFPVRFSDAVLIAPLIAVVFFKRNERSFWCLVGIGLGGLLMQSIYLILGARG
jgi:hypothetical protein